MPRPLQGHPLFGDPSLLYYFPLNGNSTALIGNSTGTNTSVTFSSSDGRFEQGGHISGSGSYITLSNPPNNAITNHSLSAWVNFTTAVVRGTVVYGQAGTGNALWEISQDDVSATGKLAAIFRGVDGTLIHPKSSASYNDGKWHHVVATHTNLAHTLYVDGVSVATGTGATDCMNSNTQFFIGANNAHGNNWNGSICDVSIWTRVLTAAEVLSLYVPVQFNNYQSVRADDGISVSVVG